MGEKRGNKYQYMVIWRRAGNGTYCRWDGHRLEGKGGGPTGGEIGDADDGPELAADRAFPGAGRPHDYADSPCRIIGRQLGFEVEIAAGFGIEKGLDAGGSVAGKIAAAIVYLDHHITW